MTKYGSKRMLTLICGLPNAGKTTYSQRFENVVHFDDVKPVGNSMQRAIRELLELESGDVCIEGVFPTEHSRKSALRCYDGDSRCIWLDVPIETCCERENRGRATVLIKNCAEIFEPPTYDEGWDEIEVIR